MNKEEGLGDSEAQRLLDDSFTASPAAAWQELFLRGERYLYAIAAE